MARYTYQDYDTDLVFAAATAAYRMKGNEYVKAGAYNTDENGVATPVQSNRELISELVKNPDQIIESDRTTAADVRRYYQGLSFKILSGKMLGELDAKALALASGNTISERDFGIVAYLPQGHERAQVRQNVDDRIQYAAGGLIGKIGDKIKMQVEVLRCSYSQKFGVFFVTALSDKDQPLFFAYKNQLQIGGKINITGAVKAHRDSQTQLNRVKIV